MTVRRPSAVVFTDLDGTLLGHHDYATEGARPGLQFCAERRIPVIPNTSKTRVEVLELMAALDLHWAAIVENGSAVVMPAESPWCDALPLTDCCLGLPRADIQAHLAELRAETGVRCTAFHEMNLDQIAALTELPEASARLASAREYSEPLYWQDSDDALVRLTAAAQARGLQCLRGGRFVHLLGQTNKGAAARALMSGLGLAHVPMIALGDAPNDAAMIEAADVGVWVRAPKRLPPEVQARSRTYQTTQQAPSGWTEGIHAAFAASIGDETPTTLSLVTQKT